MGFSEDFEREWTRCSPWIEAALAPNHGTYLLEDVKAEILAGRAQFWPGKRCAEVTEIVEYPRKKALHFWLSGGSGRELVLKMRPAIEAWARERGCTLFFGSGPPDGAHWGRAVARFGYRPDWLCWMKDEG